MAKEGFKLARNFPFPNKVAWASVLPRMRKRVILFCLFTIILFGAVRIVIERSAERSRRYGYDRDQYGRYDDRAVRNDNLTPPPPAPSWTESGSTPSEREDPAPVTATPPAPTSPELLNPPPMLEPVEVPPGLELAVTEEPKPAPRLREEQEADTVAPSGVVVAPPNEVVISEIMYYPQPVNDHEDTRREFVEIHNPGTEPIDLTGYQFTRGIHLTLPSLTLPPKGYAVAVSNKQVFSQLYRRVNAKWIMGEWTGKLSNSGEELRLEDAEGNVVDRVAYADQGDWAQRIRTNRVAMSHRSNWSGRRSYSSSRSGYGAGWVWHTPANGEGMSMELITAKLSNNRGANWLPSKGQGGTPGAPNSVAARDVAPLISRVRHDPPVPLPNQKVQIYAEIADEIPGTIRARVVWRVSQYRRGEEFQVVEMKRLADGRYQATLPGKSDKDVIEFYIEATDGDLSRTWPAPTNTGQSANALYQVDSELRPQPRDPHLPGKAMYRLVMTEEENRNFGDNRHSNAESNTTLIADDGSGPIIRYLCGTRIRGAGSRSHSPPPMRVNVPRDRPWNGATRMNLNSVNSWLQFLGMKLFQAADLPAPNMLPVLVRRNGRDYTRKSSSDYGAYVHAQTLDGNFIREHFPHDSGGNLYKKVRPDNSWAYHRGDADDYQDDGWIKQTNSGANDWRDLDQFLAVMNTASRKRDYLAQVNRVMNVEQWLRYIAVMAIVANGEGGIANGIDDDYAIYRGVKDTRFQALPHDLDTILGLGDSSRSTADRTILDIVKKGDRLNPLEDFFDRREVLERYCKIVVELLETSFSESNFELLLDTHLAGWVPDSRLDRMKNFLAVRRHFIAQEIQQLLGNLPRYTPQNPSADSVWVSAPSSPIVLSEILADNQSVMEHRGGFPDYIELFNRSGSAVSLAGFSLTDDGENPAKFIFPEGTEIPAGGYLLLYADGQSAEGEWHTGFSLKREGETLTLFGRSDSKGERPVLDTVTFGPQITDHAIGRGGAALDRWSLTQPTPGAANQGVATQGPGLVRINEWLARPDARFSNDFVELINFGDQPVTLSGLCLTNDAINAPKALQMPPLSYLKGKGTLLFETLGKRSRRRHACDLPFRLRGHHGWLTLTDAQGVLLDKQHYFCQARDRSRGRSTSNPNVFASYRMPSPGHPNNVASAKTGSVSALLEGLRVSEIMYHPKDPKLEFIELTNIGSTTLSLDGVRFTNGIDFTFEGGELAPGALVTLVADESAFRAVYGDGVIIGGVYQGKLSNGGETLELTLPRPGNLAIQRFEFDDRWYGETDGEGHSLVPVNLQAAVQEWSAISQWRPSDREGGSPGSP